MTWCLKCYFQEYFISSGGNVFIQWHKRLAKSLFMGAIKMLRFHSSQLGRSSRYSHRTEPAGGYYTETVIYMQNKPEKKKSIYSGCLNFYFTDSIKYTQRKSNITLMDIGMLVTCIHFFLQFLMIQNFFCFLIKFVTFKRRHLYL